MGLVSSLLEHFFCAEGNSEFFRGNKPELETNKELLDRVTVTPSPGGLKYLILTTAGGRAPRRWGQRRRSSITVELPRNLQPSEIMNQSFSVLRYAIYMSMKSVHNNVKHEIQF